MTTTPTEELKGVDPSEVAASKEEAQELGLSLYTGTPCRKAGHTVRYVSGGACVPCNRQSTTDRKEPSEVSEEDTLRGMFLYALRTQWREEHRLPYCGFVTAEAWANGLSYEPEQEEEGSTVWWLIGSDGQWYQKEPQAAGASSITQEQHPTTHPFNTLAAR